MLMDLRSLHSDYRMQVNGVLHLGGHTGEEAEAYSSLGFQPVFWIEAETDSYFKLVEHLSSFQRNYALNCVVSDSVGETEFYSANNGQSSSMLRPNLHLMEHPEVLFSESVVMSTTTVDTLFEFGLIEQCNFVNLDIQGAELKALRGAIKFLETVEYVYSEVNVKELYDGCVLIDELDEFLEQFGLVRVDTVLTEHGWGDAFYARVA